ncbi:MAG TPA: FAD-binding oxidoreductase [Propionibacterium sp.]|nr:FAD-binding oxidoreductase [Propionibacterium sp.]
MTESTRSRYLTSNDAEYAAAHASWNLAYQHRPAVVAQPSTVDEVADAVRYAGQRGLKVGIQVTGHGPCALGDDTALLLSLRKLNRFSINPERAEVTLGGGVRWDDLLGAAQDHGLAPLLGSAPHIGAVGYTLGGGFGWLARQHGLAVDRVRSLTVVLADGSVVTASPTEHPDLFWALCGAGAGSLGVVVEMTMGLVPVREVYAGNLLYPADATVEVFGFWREWVRGIDSAMTSSLNIMAFPDLEIVPPPLRGETFTIVRGCHCGDQAEGAALVDRVRAWRAPIADLFGPMPFREMAVISQDPVDPLPATSSGRWLSDADSATVEAMVDFVGGGGLFAELRHSGGTVRRPNPAVSYAARDAEFVLDAVAVTPTSEAVAAAFGALDQLMAATEPHHAALPAYLNFVTLDERRKLARKAFGAADLQRLAAVKRDVDPGGLFGYGVLE